MQLRSPEIEMFSYCKFIYEGYPCDADIITGILIRMPSAQFFGCHPDSIRMNHIMNIFGVVGIDAVPFNHFFFVNIFRLVILCHIPSCFEFRICLLFFWFVLSIHRPIICLNQIWKSAPECWMPILLSRTSVTSVYGIDWFYCIIWFCIMYRLNVPTNRS